MGVKPVFSYSKPHTFPTYFGEEKICIYFLHPGHLKAEQNNRKVKRSKMKKKGVKIAHQRGAFCPGSQQTTTISILMSGRYLQLLPCMG